MSDDEAPAPFPSDEAARLALLRGYRILDTPRDLVFDRFAIAAAALLDAPAAGVAFVDERRHWWKARLGISLQDQPRHGSFCAAAILSADVLVIPDTRAQHGTTTQHGETRPAGFGAMRFYAGAPIGRPGLHVGTLCVLDYQPRSPTPQQISSLRNLAGGVTLALEARKARLSGRVAHAELRGADSARRGTLQMNGW